MWEKVKISKKWLHVKSPIKSFKNHKFRRFSRPQQPCYLSNWPSYCIMCESDSCKRKDLLLCSQNIENSALAVLWPLLTYVQVYKPVGCPIYRLTIQMSAHGRQQCSLDTLFCCAHTFADFTADYYLQVNEALRHIFWPCPKWCPCSPPIFGDIML